MTDLLHLRGRKSDRRNEVYAKSAPHSVRRDALGVFERAGAPIARTTVRLRTDKEPK